MIQEGTDNYVGRRILEAMHSAVRYSDTVFHHVQKAMPQPPCKVLDFGAGDGMFVERFRRNGVVVDCVEPDIELRSQLKSTGALVFPDSRVIGAASYDFVYSINVLEHISDLQNVCIDLYRIVRPGGKLFVFVPAFNLLWTSLDDEAGHVQRFTRQSLQKILQQSGFRADRIEYFDSLGFPACLAVRGLEAFNLFKYNGNSVGFYDRYLFPASRSLDRAFRAIFGKNVLAVLHRPA